MTAETFLLATPGPAELRRSPLQHRAAELAAVSRPTLREQAFEPILNLRVPADSPIAAELGLPGAGRATTLSRPGWQALWLGPDEWLLVGRTGRAASELLGDGLRLVDVSANYAGLLISGPHARDLLEKAITLDLHPRAFGPGHCAQTTFARGNVILWQVGLDPAYRLMFRPSFATYFADWLIDAAQEFRTDRA